MIREGGGHVALFLGEQIQSLISADQRLLVLIGHRIGDGLERVLLRQLRIALRQIGFGEQRIVFRNAARITGSLHFIVVSVQHSHGFFRAALTEIQTRDVGANGVGAQQLAHACAGFDALRKLRTDDGLSRTLENRFEF